MLKGVGPIGSVVQGGSIPLNFGVESAVTTALRDNQTPKYIIKAYPYDPDIDDVVIFRAAEEGKPVKLSNSYPPIVEEAFNLSSSILQPDLTKGLGGPPSRGSIKVAMKRNEDDPDDFERYDWKNRNVEVWRGFDGITESEWELVRTDRAQGILITETGFTIELKDQSLDLTSEPFHNSIFAGTGFLEGDINLTDHHRPVALGVVLNATPVLIDRINYVYQISDRQIRSVDAVRDKGLSQSEGGLAPASGGLNDIADLDISDVWEWVPEPGYYITDLSLGLIRLGGVPTGVVTADVHGYGIPVGLGEAEIIQIVPHANFNIVSNLTHEDDYVATGWYDTHSF